MDKITTDKYLRIGKINGIFGLDGWVKIYPYAAFGQFNALRDIVLADEKTLEIKQAARVEKVNTASNKVKIKLKGIDSPEAAESLTHLEIWVDRDKMKMADDEYPIQDILGCEVIYGGRAVGKVDGVYSLAQDILEVELYAGGSVMIPMVEVFILGVDMPNRRITVDKLDELM